MATAYHPLPRTERSRWLLTNGEIAFEPEIEQSDSGRRVRLKGDEKSVYAKDIDDLILRGMHEYANSIGESLWIRVRDDDPVSTLNDSLGAPQRVERPHVISDASHASRWYSQSTEINWTFRHKSLPIAARITVTLTSMKQNYHQPTGEFKVSAEANWMSTNPSDHEEVRLVRADTPTSIRFPTPNDPTISHQNQRLIDSLQKERPEWFDLLGEFSQGGNARQAVVAMGRLCRKVDELDEIQIPDMRNPGEWLTLGLYETTYTSDFSQSIVDYVNGEPIVEQLKGHWAAMQELFRQAGIVVSDPGDQAWSLALEGNADALQGEIKSVHTPDGEPEDDRKHVVGFNLVTGTITVTCSITDARPEEAATEYEIARIRAEARDELESFLGFQANYLHHAHHKRHQQIVSDRTVDCDF